MAVRFYLLPKTGTGVAGDIWRPKYFIDGDGTKLIGGMAAHIRYGSEPVYLVAADVTGGEHTTINANGDVTAVPANLDNTIGANLATVQAELEAFGIPVGWINSGMTYRQVVKWIIRLFYVAQRMEPFRMLPPGITLNSTIGDLTVNQRNYLQDAATSLGASSAGVTLATTIRAALKLLVDQLPEPAQILGVAL